MMRNYETCEGLSKEEHEIQLPMFAAADPIYFEEAVKVRNIEHLWMQKWKQ